MIYLLDGSTKGMKWSLFTDKFGRVPDAEMYCSTSWDMFMSSLEHMEVMIELLKEHATDITSFLYLHEDDLLADFSYNRVHRQSAEHVETTVRHEVAELVEMILDLAAQPTKQQILTTVAYYDAHTSI